MNDHYPDIRPKPLEAPEMKPRRLNWHLTESDSGMSWSVGATEEEPGHYPPEDTSTCDCIIAPGEYVEQHPEVRRSGFVDAAIRQAINDWWRGVDVEELERKYHAWLVEDVYEITREDLERFKEMDAFGEAARLLFETVFEAVDLSSEQPYDVVERWDILQSMVEQSGLSRTQRNAFLVMLQSIREDTRALEPLHREGLSLSMARRTGARGAIHPTEVSSLHLPGALGFIIDPVAYKRVYPEKRAHGFTIRVFQERDLLGKMFVANGTQDVGRTIRHEYAHVLFGNYFRPLMERMNQESGSGFSDPDAQELFLQMKDELTAYSAGDEYALREDVLLRGAGTQFEERLKYIHDNEQRDRFIRGWEKVKEEIQECMRMGIPAVSLFSIFISSDNFDVMQKRLFLLREENLSS